MNNFYLQELIEETQNRGGGLILNYEDRPAVVVLTVEKYNTLLQNQESATRQTPEPQTMTGERIMNQGRQTSNETQPEIPQAQPPKKVLVTGGAGYIGGHLVRELIKQDYEVVVLDNLSSGRRENLDTRALFVEGDLADQNLLRDLFVANKFEAVFHMAASLEVEESMREPEKYFRNNVLNTANLLNAMNEAGVKKIIFSSTAAIYGESAEVPISETAPLHPNNPYGSSKLLAERTIKYYCEYLGFTAVVFRYFNACGFDVEAKILPTHQSHLIYNVMQVAKGEKSSLTVFGNDYPTFDGTGVRDYVHVLDIALPHIEALKQMKSDSKYEVYNIGTGVGLSVAQIVNGAAEILNKIIPMDISPRRLGDSAVTIADNTKLVNGLGYRPRFSDLDTIITTSWEVFKNI